MRGGGGGGGVCGGWREAGVKEGDRRRLIEEAEGCVCERGVRGKGGWGGAETCGGRSARDGVLDVDVLFDVEGRIEVEEVEAGESEELQVRDRAT